MLCKNREGNAVPGNAERVDVPETCARLCSALVALSICKYCRHKGSGGLVGAGDGSFFSTFSRIYRRSRSAWLHSGSSTPSELASNPAYTCGKLRDLGDREPSSRGDVTISSTTSSLLFSPYLGNCRPRLPD